MIIVSCTLASFILGVSLLPTRRSPVKYTVGGFGVGVGVSYGFWRVQLNRYDKGVNQMFKKIVREQYQEKKGGM